MMSQLVPVCIHFPHKKEVNMETKMVLADVPEEIKEEVSILYRLGVAIEDIEYVISKRLKCSQART